MFKTTYNGEIYYVKFHTEQVLRPTFKARDYVAKKTSAKVFTLPDNFPTKWDWEKVNTVSIGECICGYGDRNCYSKYFGQVLSFWLAVQDLPDTLKLHLFFNYLSYFKKSRHGKTNRKANELIDTLAKVVKGNDWDWESLL